MYTTRIHLYLTLLALACTTFGASPIQPGQIKNLVTFGDSYTDLSYRLPADGGRRWPLWVAGYGPFNLHGFAKAGATCSNYLTYRPFPSIMEYQLPNYLNITRNGTVPASSILPNETMYAIWIGTNDVGVNALLTDGIGVSIVEVRQCVIDVVMELYEGGARIFIIMNMIPLELTPLYSANSYPNKYWYDTRNTTAWNVFMYELVRGGNAITDLFLQTTLPVLSTAHIASFDTHALFVDMYSNPSAYLNGTGPENVTGCIRSCVMQLGGSGTDSLTCTTVEGEGLQDGYLWFDELHPSEQANRIVAREITAVLKGEPSRWATWWS